MDVRNNAANCSFEAVENGLVVTALTWDWARERGARFTADLVTVAVDGERVVHDEPPGGWLDRPIKTRVVDGETVVVQSVRELPADCPAGWTISQRWKLRAWSPLSASVVTVVVGQDGVARVGGEPAGPGALAAGTEPCECRAVRFTRADGRLIDDVLVDAGALGLDLDVVEL